MPFQRLQARQSGRRIGPKPLHVVLALSVILNIWLLLRGRAAEDVPVEDVPGVDASVSGESPEPGGPEEAATQEDPEATTEGSSPVSNAAGSEAVVETAEAPSLDPPVVPLDIPARFIRVSIDGPLSRGFIKQLGSPLGDRLALTMTRLLVWNMHLQKDPRPGDIADLLFKVKEDGQVHILALRYLSKKYGKEFTAWSYKAPGTAYSSWFDSVGREVPGRLGGGPIAEFEEVTSLLGDGRGHSGMDFKAPVGTPITAPFDATVTRSNWRWKYNGNCLELRSARGTTARFLHLSGLADGIVPGASVRKGQKVAFSGNTGRSSAPHLHYELASSGGKTLDPLDFHDVTHSLLTGEAAAGFTRRKAELEGWLTKALAHRAQ